MTKLFTLLFTLLVAFHASAQVSGKVTDPSGEALIGVTVAVKGAATGTSTAVDGTFRLAAPSNGVLVFSYTGYASQEISIAGQSVINVVLVEDVKTLEQIVVVGYGTQKKKDLTTAVVVIDEKDIRDRPMVSAAEALQGKAAGVQVVHSLPANPAVTFCTGAWCNLRFGRQ